MNQFTLLNRNMEYIKDSVDYSVPEFFEMFEHKFPKIVIVTQGYFGEILDDIFDRDQVSNRIDLVEILIKIEPSSMY